MNAKELFEIVKDVPREALPSNRAMCQPFVDSAMSYLRSKAGPGGCSYYSQTEDGWVTCASNGAGIDIVRKVGGSPVEALAAACKAVGT